MAVSKAQHAAHGNMISQVAKFFGPKTASAADSSTKFSNTRVSSTIPGVGTPMVRGSAPRPASANFPFATNQKTYGAPGAK